MWWEEGKRFFQNIFIAPVSPWHVIFRLSLSRPRYIADTHHDADKRCVIPKMSCWQCCADAIVPTIYHADNFSCRQHCAGNIAATLLCRQCHTEETPWFGCSKSFLDATKRLYMSVCPYVGWSVGPSVGHAFAFRPSRSDLWPCIRPC